jgi:WD40 repeat protein
MMRRLMLLLVLLLTGFKAQAADVQPVGKPVFKDGSISPSSIFWWGNRLYFTDTNTYSDLHVTYQYDLKTQRLEPIASTPWLVDLAPQQREHYRAVSTKAYISPDKQMMVYVSQADKFSPAEGGLRSHLFAIGQHLDDPKARGWYFPIRAGADFTRNYIYWNDNSNAFLLMYDSPYGGGTSLRYIKLNRVHPDGEIRETTLEGFDTFQSIYDISPDGNRILFPSFDGYELRLWDARIPLQDGDTDASCATKTIADAKTIGAAFIPDDENHILMVDGQGISRYDLNTHIRQSINPKINSAWAGWASFSPDNQYVALLGENLKGSVLFTDVYVLPVNASE